MPQLESAIERFSIREYIGNSASAIDYYVLAAKIRARELAASTIKDGLAALLSFPFYGYAVPYDQFRRNMKLNFEAMSIKLINSLNLYNVDEWILGLDTKYNEFVMRRVLSKKLKRADNGYRISGNDIKKEGHIVGTIGRGIIGEMVLVSFSAPAELLQMIYDAGYPFRRVENLNTENRKL